MRWSPNLTYTERLAYRLKDDRRYSQVVKRRKRNKALLRHEVLREFVVNSSVQPARVTVTQYHGDLRTKEIANW